MGGLNRGLWRVGTVVVCMRYVFYGRRNGLRRKQKLNSENYNGGGENDERENGASGKGGRGLFGGADEGGEGHSGVRVKASGWESYHPCKDDRYLP